MTIRTTVLALSLACCFVVAGCLKERGQGDKVGLHLAAAGQTEYAIVKPEKPSLVDEYAVSTLTNFLFQKTGADFPVVTSDKMSAGKKYIFVGISAPVIKIAGSNPLGRLKDQEYIAKSVNADILLYGKGLHGNLYAIMDFMENILGRRWYSKNNKPIFTVARVLEIQPFDIKGGFSFAFRFASYHNEFLYQQGINMGWTEQNETYKKRHGKDLFPEGVVSFKYLPGFPHSTFGYIPPSPDRVHWSREFDWVKNTNYFKTNPEFFTMDKSGKRVGDLQLCFSNPGLRREFTKNVLEHIKLLGEERKDLIIPVLQEDVDSRMCECPDCLRMEQEYQNPGGAMFDYVFELCAVLKGKYPDVMVMIGPYKKSKRPIVLPQGKTFPENLMVVFPDNQDRIRDLGWDIPDNATNYNLMLGWGKMSKHLWFYCYPNLYSAGSLMPFGNMGMLINDLKMAKRAGAEGFFPDSGASVACGYGFTELQQYLYCKLLKDIDRDVPALIKEFTDCQYGPAAARARTYYAELEDARQTSKNHMLSYNYSVIDFKGEFAYLTDARIRRWNGYFDQMEKDTAADERLLGNVKRLRMPLVFATLAKWHDLAKAYPDYFKDYTVYLKRYSRDNCWFNEIIDDWETIIKAGGKQKPLPAQFDGIDKSLIRQLIPSNKSGKNPPFKVRLDPDAAFGYGATIDLPDLPFHYGFYQWDTKKDDPRCELKKESIQPGVYHVYALGEIKVTPKCVVWFSSKSWCTNLELGNFYDPDDINLWDAWVSLKFDGPSYGGKAKEDLVLCDRIIFVKKNGK